MESYRIIFIDRYFFCVVMFAPWTPLWMFLAQFQFTSSELCFDLLTPFNLVRAMAIVLLPMERATLLQPILLMMMLLVAMLPGTTAMPKEVNMMKELDTSTAVPRKLWYDAAADKEFWVQYVRDFQTCGDLHCLDVFSGKAAISTAFKRAGFRSCTFEIKDDRSHDCVSKDGFATLLHLSLRLCGSSAVIVAGPPCSMFGFWTSSQHMRSLFGPYGRPSDPTTVLANMIAINFITLLQILQEARPLFMPRVVIEQPRGSWMFKLPEYASPQTGAIAVLGLLAVSTFMGFFVSGHSQANFEYFDIFEIER